MLKRIAEVSPELDHFMKPLNLRLSRSQQRHVTQIADGMITVDCVMSKTVGHIGG